MAIRSGELRHRIRIEQRATEQDAAGEPAATWTLVAERWASVEQFPGKETFTSEQRVARLPTRIRLRYLAGVVPSMRVVWAGRVFNVIDVQLPRGVAYAGAEMVLSAEELVGETP